MLEIPESHTIARQLDETVKGKTIAHIVAGASPHKFAFFQGDPADYQALLTGKTIDGSHPVAGQVEIRAGNARVVLSDGANIRYFEPGTKLPAAHQLFIGFTDGSAIVCTVQMYAFLCAFPEGANDNPYYLAALEKPSPLEPSFDRKYFESLISCTKQNMSLKAFLSTEQRIPGLGNGVLQDILFNARLHPKRKLETLSTAEKDALFSSVRRTLSDMTSLGGRDTEKDLFGRPGGYTTLLSAKTVKAPCPICGGEIVRLAYLGGNVYFCPVCQPE